MIAKNLMELVLHIMSTFASWRMISVLYNKAARPDINEARHCSPSYKRGSTFYSYVETLQAWRHHFNKRGGCWKKIRLKIQSKPWCEDKTYAICLKSDLLHAVLYWYLRKSQRLCDYESVTKLLYMLRAIKFNGR